MRCSKLKTSFSENGETLNWTVSKSPKIVFKKHANFSSVQNLTSSLLHFSAWFIKTTYVNQVSCYFPIRTLEAQYSGSARWEGKLFCSSKRERGVCDCTNFVPAGLVWLTWCKLFHSSLSFPFFFFKSTKLTIHSFYQNSFCNYNFNFTALHLFNSYKFLLTWFANHWATLSQKWIEIINLVLDGGGL